MSGVNRKSRGLVRGVKITTGNEDKKWVSVCLGHRGMLAKRNMDNRKEGTNVLFSRFSTVEKNRSFGLNQR
jgi:hypothetical protein